MSISAPCTVQDLRENEMFSGLAAAALEKAFACARIRTLARNVTVFSQGEPAAKAHALLRGRVRIAHGDPDGAQFLVRIVGPGQVFGALGLFTDHTYPASAVTVTACAEISWTEAALRGLIADHPQIALNLVRIAGQRLHEAQERLGELATQRAERRIAHALIRLAEQAGHQTVNGTRLGFPLGRKDLADMCGATLHTVSRTLTVWEKLDFLSTSQQLITIHNLAEIRRRAED
jgi:CRP-like cAMP-binding protein